MVEVGEVRDTEIFLQLHVLYTKETSCFVPGGRFRAKRDRLETLVPARGEAAYRGTSLIRKHLPVGTCSRTMSRAIWWPSGGGVFLMSEVTLYEVPKWA